MTDDPPTTEEPDDGVLSPTQLDPDDEHIERLDDHRYVVTLDATEDEAENDGVAGASSSDTGTGEDHDSGNREDYDSGNADDHDPSGGAVPPGADGDTDRRRPDLDGAYACELHARFETTEDAVHIDSDDVSETFASLLRWYAARAGDDVPPGKVIATLLEHSDLDVRASYTAGRTDR
jgi:hypothetical protein